MNDTAHADKIRPAALSIFLPREHGSWSLALEPIVLGMIVAPTIGGGGLAVAALAAFFARRPLRLSIAPGTPGRRRSARAALGLLLMMAAAGLLEAWVLGGIERLWPLAMATVSGALFLYFDLCGGSRAYAAEVAGAATYSFLPAAFASLAGWPVSAALALTALMQARSVPTVMTVRSYLRTVKGQGTSIVAPLLASAVAALAATALAYEHLAPWSGSIATLALAGRAAALLTVVHGSWSARQVGFTEALLGLGYILAIALAYWA